MDSTSETFPIQKKGLGANDFSFDGEGVGSGFGIARKLDASCNDSFFLNRDRSGVILLFLGYHGQVVRLGQYFLDRHARKMPWLLSLALRY